MPGKGKPFEKGNKLAKGGRRENSGRKPDWFKQQCDELLHNRKLIDRVADVAEGKEVFRRYSITGKPYKCAAGPEAQLHAFDSIADRAWGRPAQSVEHSGDIGVNIFDLIRQAEKERGLPSSFDD